jgi:hypothetical protein
MAGISLRQFLLMNGADPSAGIRHLVPRASAGSLRKMLTSNSPRNFPSPTIGYTDSNGYSYVETSLLWKQLCSILPCFDALQWPDYASTHIGDVINGQPVVIQLWKGWCQRFLGLKNFPGGIGAEVGVYHRMPGRARPTSLPFLPSAMEAFILKGIASLTDNELWWPFPELNAQVEFMLVNPVTKLIFFNTAPENTYWLAKWMNEDSYDKYEHDQTGTPFFAVGYLLDYKVNGKSYPGW